MEESFLMIVCSPLSSHLLLLTEFTLKPARKEIVKPPPPDFGPSSNTRKWCFLLLDIVKKIYRVAALFLIFELELELVCSLFCHLCIFSASPNCLSLSTSHGKVHGGREYKKGAMLVSMSCLLRLFSSLCLFFSFSFPSLSSTLPVFRYDLPPPFFCKFLFFMEKKEESIYL